MIGIKKKKKKTYDKPVVKVSKTIYPNWELGDNGTPIISPNGTGEFYGLIQIGKK